MLGIIGHEMQLYEQDRQRREAYRQLIPIADRCDAGDVSACDALLALPLPPNVRAAGDAARLRAIEATREHYDTEDHAQPAPLSADFDACLNGSDSACDRALQNGDPIETMTINQWRQLNRDASPSTTAAVPLATPERQPPTLQTQGREAGGARLDSAPYKPAGGLHPALGGIVIVGGLIAAFLTVALIYFLRTRHPQASPFARIQDAPKPAKAASSHSYPDAARRHPAFAPDPVDAPSTTQPPPIPPSPATMKAAHQALRLAAAYLDDAANIDLDSMSPEEALELRNFAALAMRQLKIAAANDPSATITLTSPDTGEAQVWTQSELRAKVLFAEAVSYFHERPKRAIEILKTMTEVDPTFTDHYKVLGLLYCLDYRQADAVACLEKALQYDPDNIELLKALDRAQHMSAASGHLHNAAASARFARKVVYPFYFVFLALPLRFFALVLRLTLPLPPR
jgi:tetratricopeptide (TPR) repeat protein